MAVNNELIHAGLPWTNPQKVTIKSDEYVSDMTINRGFLNLLNNDYYLDLKTEALNKYIETQLDTHITDTNIHFPWEDVLNLLSNVMGLDKHSIFRIPLYQTTQIYGISTLKHLIEKCPKNLNKYIAIFEFCIPASVVIGQVINDEVITTENYKTHLKLSIDDIDKSLFGPSDLNSIYLTKDLGDTCFSFDNFYGGTVIVYGNNNYFIDDISNTNIFETSIDDYTITQTLKYLQQKIINPTTPETSNNLITLKSRGINAKYSVLSFRNNYSECYLYNLKIENSMKLNDTINYVDYDFPEYNDIILYWPLLDNFNAQIINRDYIQNNYSYILNKQNIVFDSISGYGVTEGNISGIEMNTNRLNTLSGLINPGYMWLDNNINDSSTKYQSNTIKNILYNSDGRVPHSTIIFWGYKTESDNTNNPFITDYNVNTQTGLYISHESIEKVFNNYNTNALDAYQVFPTDYVKYESQLLNNWVMYVYEIQHSGGFNPHINSELSRT